ncbi:hypothetical protein O0881_21085 [Janthinobacterium sp. SUN100]|uniref:DUF6959 family protein n=1 Tax=Janthinobacterium sp. SUN100 TaxID=3004101 RepID=UPI0025B08240|nr:hypothetical protein [Janthinobacterium sp. SUN100]MDN2704479.1 hypothetical protein [Janthinobacterium sp. SUN100]
MSEEVILLSNPSNFAVVQLPERNFPGVVVQGDTLNSLVSSLKEMSQLLEAHDFENLAAGLADMEEQLGDALIKYEKICRERKIELPYSPTS